MQILEVGGCVRDRIMDVTPKDIDRVVVGASPKEMLDLGMKQVGADFPVFLDPVYGDEYALARSETKTGEGYGGFSYEWEGVSLQEDLSRRDLTINAIAYEPLLGQYHDYHGGMSDICNKILRHTSEAFAEDPVRVLRIGRFLARFGDDWAVAPETYALCQKVAWKEFDSLTAERVWLETQKALSEPHPWLFFEFLYMLDYVWFKELFALKSIPQPITHHPENCTFDHVMLCLKQGVGANASPRELFAILCHDLGKAPCWNERGNLHGHEETGVGYVEALCNRLKVPSSYRDLAIKVCENHQRSHRAIAMKPKSVHNLFKKLDCIRRPEVLDSFNLCNYADASGRLGMEGKIYPQAHYLDLCLAAVQKVNKQDVINHLKEENRNGKIIGEAIRSAEIAAIRGVKNKWQKKTTLG